MSKNKPFAPSAERNKQAILNELKNELTINDVVLEYGSGTAQHLTHFARATPSVNWIPSDLIEQHTGIQQWLDEAMCPNIMPPIELDLRNPVLPNIKVTACYTSNTFHIVSWESVQQAFKCSATLLDTGEKFFVYGPFSFNGQHTSQGNIEIDQQLRSSNPDSGIRDLDELNLLARQHGFSTARATPMPANNQLLIWQRS